MQPILMILGALVLIPFVIFYSALSWGFVASKLYVWFILSAIPGLPDFGIIQFAGFALFVNTIVHHERISIKDEFKDKSNWGWTVVLAPWLTLFCGWLIKFFL